jgi:hypothetical protein
MWACSHLFIVWVVLLDHWLLTLWMPIPYTLPASRMWPNAARLCYALHWLARWQDSRRLALGVKLLCGRFPHVIYKIFMLNIRVFMLQFSSFQYIHSHNLYGCGKLEWYILHTVRRTCLKNLPVLFFSKSFIVLLGISCMHYMAYVTHVPNFVCVKPGKWINVLLDQRSRENMVLSVLLCHAVVIPNYLSCREVFTIISNLSLYIFYVAVIDNMKLESTTVGTPRYYTVRIQFLEK